MVLQYLLVSSAFFLCLVAFPNNTMVLYGCIRCKTSYALSKLYKKLRNYTDVVKVVSFNFQELGIIGKLVKSSVKYCTNLNF